MGRTGVRGRGAAWNPGPADCPETRLLSGDSLRQPDSQKGRAAARGMRESFAAAHTLAHERCNEIGISVLLKSSNTRSAFPPEGSVIQNDIKQQLAKERREEKKRQQDATKEIQLLEKERKSKIHYEKQMEEKQRKLQEQKQKDEQRRISAEEKRKQKFREDREKFKAVLSRTLERSSRIEQRQKRWSLEGPNTVNPESKMANRQLISSEKLELETSGSHKKKNVSSSGVQHSNAKVIQSPVLRYTVVPLSSNQLKNTTMLCKSTVTMPPQKKVETPLRVNLQAAPETSSAEAPEVSSAEAPEANSAGASEVNLVVHPEVSVGTTPKVKVEAFSESSEILLKGSEYVSLVSVDPSPDGSMDSSSKLSLNSSPEVSMEIPSGTSKEMSHKGTMDTIPEESLEAVLKENMDKPSETSVELSPNSCTEVKVETSPEVKVKATPQNILGAIERGETVASLTADSSQAVCQKHISNEESGDKSTEEVMNAEEATNISAAKPHSAREQREREKLEKEMEQRKVEDEIEKTVEDQEEFSKSDNEQPQTEVKQEDDQDQESQKALLQEEDTKTKTQKEDYTHKKEQEIIMLKDLEERLERIKRIEEIMKQTKKTDLNASKVAQTSVSDLCGEREADDEDESESDDADSLHGFHPPAFLKSMTSSTKLRTSFKSMKKNPRLLFLDINSDKIRTKARSSLKSKVKARKCISLSTRRMTNRLTKTRKPTETSNTMVPYKGLYTLSPEYICEQILEDAETETAVSRMFPCGQKQSPKGITAFHQSPQIPLDDKNRNESDSACSDV
ncbi:MAP7 domain-containing protein 3 [Rhynchonycteris naso]